MNFEPRAVPPSSWRGWLVTGVALSTRRTGAFVLFGALCVAAHALLGTVGLGAMAVPMAFGTGCLLAECADHGRPVIGALRAKPWRVHARLVLVGLVSALAFWAIGLLVLSLGMLAGLSPESLPSSGGGTSGGLGGSGGAERHLVERWCAAWFLSAAVMLFGTSVLVGFLVPLLALGELPLREALIQALVATGRNDFVILFVSALAGSALVGLITPFLVVPWVAIVSSVLYAAYRDVFLGRADNLPAPAAAKARTAEAGQAFAGVRPAG